jgi:DNA invertase Pin-like site-specific DNA recombinase
VRKLKSANLSRAVQPTIGRAVALRYLRVSSDEQGKNGLSLDLQDTATLRYSFEQEFLPGPLFSDILTGKRDDRPGYQALLSEARRLRATGQPVVVVVWRLNRLGRRLLERTRALEELTRIGVPIHSVSEGGVLPEFVQNILAAVAQEEVRVSGENIASTLQAAKAKGWWPGGTLPFGYRWRPRTDDEKQRGAPKQVLDLEPSQAEHVAEGYRQLAAGASANSVHRWLANLPESERGGRVMHIRSVRLMFQSPLYMGRSEDDVQGQWPAIIDAETWHKAQQVFRPRGTTNREASVRYLLSGFLVCPECGSPMAGMRSPASRSRPYAQTRYRCKADVYGRSCRFGINAEPAEAAVRDELAAVLDAYADPEQRVRIDAAWRQEQEPRVVSNTERLRRGLERDMTQADTDIANAVRMLGRGEVDQRAYNVLYQDARGKYEAAESAMAKLPPAESAKIPDLPPLGELLGAAPTWSVALERGDIESQRRLLSLFVDRVIPRRVGWGKVAVGVEWTPLGNRLMMPAPAVGQQVG